MPTTAKSALANMLNQRPPKPIMPMAPELEVELLLLLLRPNGRPWYEKVRFCLTDEL